MKINDDDAPITVQELPEELPEWLQITQAHIDRANGNTNKVSHCSRCVIATALQDAMKLPDDSVHVIIDDLGYKAIVWGPDCNIWRRRLHGEAAAVARRFDDLEGPDSVFPCTVRLRQ